MARSGALVAALAFATFLASCASLSSKVEIHEPEAAGSICGVVVCPGEIDAAVLSVWPNAQEIITQVLLDQIGKETEWSAVSDSGHICQPFHGSPFDAVLRCDIRGRIKESSITTTESRINVLAVFGLGEPVQEVEVTEEWEVLRIREISLQLLDVVTGEAVAVWTRTSTFESMAARLPIEDGRMEQLTADWVGPGVKALAEACRDSEALRD